ncbi:biopolymer transport exbD protein [Rhodopirellula islandica]|uniref:Biopolymer transport exbD protein n=1 Tax=Rhodopirellula islandica TaxID=595434 RepID=A0A0J1EAP9_RHOIS|nr:biopolymer transporter ExbD [Rhodopirellula islandica]KLU02684.1 biopolymer transport exbD protein [Rhodopirellula islandica]
MNERLGGRKIRCPGCDSPITIPEAPVVAEAEPVEVELVEAEPIAMDAFEAEPVVEATVGAEAEEAGFGSPAHAAMRDELAAVSEGVEPAAFNLDDDDDALPPRKKRDDGELDMTPMVDVTFLLLIFFMVTASFSLQKSIQMPRQQSELPSTNNDPEETDEKDPVELEIDENGGFLVLAPEWEKETPGKQNLISALKEAVGDNRDGMQLNIKIHENAKLQFLVDGMDAGTIAGFAALQVTEVDGFD